MNWLIKTANITILINTVIWITSQKVINIPHLITTINFMSNNLGGISCFERIVGN